MRIRKILVICCILALFSGVVYGAGFVIEAKGIYFQPSDQDFKDIYKIEGEKFTDWIAYGAEVSITLWKGFGVWAGGHYFKKTGKLSFTGEETNITMMPVYGGVKVRLSKGTISPYIGAGVGYFKYKEENPIGTVDKGDIGYIGQAGIMFKISVLVIDFQASYTYCKVKPLELEENLGGLQGGIGIGFEF